RLNRRGVRPVRDGSAHPRGGLAPHRAPPRWTQAALRDRRERRDRTMTRDLALLRGRPSSTELLARLLERPDLAVGVQALPAPALARLIDAVGLEDAGEIVAFATPEQLAGVFDEDLFRSDRPGGDERFDGGRFLVWLEVMMEAGEAFVTERLA